MNKNVRRGATALAALAITFTFSCDASASTTFLTQTNLKYQTPTPPVRVVGTRTQADVEQFTGTLPPIRIVGGWKRSTTPVIDSLGTLTSAVDYRYWPGNATTGARHYLMKGTSSSFTYTVFDAASRAKVLERTVSIPEDMRHAESRSSFGEAVTIDPASGDIIFGTYYTKFGVGTVSRWSVATGTMVWRVATGRYVKGAIYPYQAAGKQLIGVVSAAKSGGLPGSVVIDPATGAIVGENPVVGRSVNVATARAGELVSTADDGIRVYSADAATLVSQLRRGDGERAWSQANLLPNGNIAALIDRSDLVVYTPNGFKVGRLAGDPVGAPAAIETIADSTGLVFDKAANRLIWPTQNSLTSMPTTWLTTWLTYPMGNCDAAWGLGAGMALSTPALYNYFPNGTAPKVTLSMTPDWATKNAGLVATATTTPVTALKAGRAGSKLAVALPTDPAAFGTTGATVAVPLPATSPGVYQVDLQVSDKVTGKVLGAGTLQYTVGAPGAALNFANLPTSEDAKGVEIAHRLGQSAYRSYWYLDSFYPGITTPTLATKAAPSAATVADMTAAANLAKSYGMQFIAQIGRGGRDKDLISVSPAITQNLVKQMSQAVPAVGFWEVWNEPDNNTFTGPNDYVDRAVIPMSKGLREADPTDQVIGGSLSGNSYLGTWWQTVFNRALPYINQVALHPYTGHNRSFFEQGFVAPSNNGTTSTGILTQVRTELAKRSFTGKIIDTEQGFWVSGPYNAATQGDRLIQKLIMERSIGINVTANFQNQADYLIDGLKYSLIDRKTLTTGGAASSVYQAMIAARPFAGWLVTGANHVHAAKFGTAPGTTDTVVALWTDDVMDTVKLVDATTTTSTKITFSMLDTFGARKAANADGSLPLDGSVSYVVVPAGRTLKVTSSANYSKNLLAGGTAQATSTWVSGSATALAKYAVDGITNAEGRGNMSDGKKAWSSAVTDLDPALTLTLPVAATVDRVFVTGQGLGSIETGLRGYRISFDTGSGTFGYPVTVTNQYYQRSKMTILPTPLARVKRIKIDQFQVNYGGYGNGNPNTFWVKTTAAQPVVMEVAAYSR